MTRDGVDTYRAFPLSSNSHFWPIGRNGPFLSTSMTSRMLISQPARNKRLSISFSESGPSVAARISLRGRRMSSWEKFAMVEKAVSSPPPRV